MSGSLKRLARHATGQAVPTAHAMSRLPFAQAPDLLPAKNAETLSSASPTQQPGASTEANTTRNESSHTAINQPSSRPITEPVTSLSETGVFPAPLISKLPDGGHATADTQKESDQAIAFVQPRTIGAQPQHTPSRRISSRLKEQSLPDTLLPPMSVPTTSAPPSRPHAATPEISKAVETPTEVHVHIGRIEVTALQEAAAPKSAARRGKQPMSLDNYLAKRQQNHE